MRVTDRLLFLTCAILMASAARSSVAQDESAAVRALQSKGQSLLQGGNVALGIKAFEDAVEQAKKDYGADDERTLLVQGSLAGAYQAVARFDDAVALFEKVASAVEAKYGPDHPQTYLLICGLGKFYNTASRYDDALKCFHRSLSGLEKTLEPGHVAIVEALEGLINTYINAGRTALAEPYIRRKIQILEAKNGAGHPDTVSAQEVLAGVLAKLNRFDDAEAFIARSVDGLKTRAGPDDVQTVRLQAVLAQLKILRGRPDEAKPLLENALAVLERKRGRDDPDTCKVMGILGDLYRTKSQFDKAEPLLRDSLTLTQARVGLAHADALEAYLRLSSLLIDMGRKEEAVALLRTGLNTIEQRIGRNHQAAVGFRNALASLGQPTGGSPAVPPRVEIVRAFGQGSLEAALGADAIEMQKVPELIKRGQFVLAEATQKRILASVQEKLGADHPVTATLLAGLSMTYLAAGRLKDAEEFARHALAVYDVKFGSDHPHTAAAREVLAASLVKQDRVPEGLDVFEMARRSRRRILEQILPGLAEDEQLAFLHTSFTSGYNLAMGAAWAARRRPLVADSSAGWIVNHKAVALAALAQRAVLARLATDSRVGSIARKLIDTRQQFAGLALVTAMQSSDSAGPKPEFDRLAGHERELSRQLGQALNQPKHDDPWVALDQVRAALPPDAVLVEFARFSMGVAAGSSARPIGPGAEGRYVAWLIPPRDAGEVRLIDLGESGPIDDAIGAVRRAIKPDKEQYALEGEPDSLKRLTPALATLGGLILQPLRPEIDSARRWVLCPDSLLWLVPWQALPVGDGRYAIERHLIHLVVSGRDLVAPEETVSEEAPVIFADPDFDLGQPAGGANAAPVPAPGALTPGEIASLTRGFPPGSRAIRLRSTGTEADLVAPRMEKYAGKPPDVYKREKATEERFRKVRRPRVFLLGTHGFFWNQADPTAADGLKENPLLRCGLLLAGFNTWAAASSANRDVRGLDGVLTGMEIVGSDLQGTDLVVLSACETAIGEVPSGEGVAGLRQAFQLAGAQSVIATLWQVPDDESARLINGFFGHLSSGKGPASALRQAQLDEIVLRRPQYGAAHPFFWAAFTLTGRPGLSWKSERVDVDRDAPLPAAGAGATPKFGETRGIEVVSPRVPQASEDAPSSLATAPSADSWPRNASTREAPAATDHPVAEGAVLILVVAGSVFAARWWWRKGSPQSRG